ncbi:MAG: hypothetical protein WCW40_12140, partial [Bacteroidota bacterium]
MKTLQQPSFSESAHKFLLVFTSAAVLVMLFSSCSTNLPLHYESPQAEQDQQRIQYSVIAVIHGDGDYVFHDTRGIKYYADEVALENIKKAALRNPRAEVFIYHQKAKSHILGLIPLHDGEFFYYRNGGLVAQKSYWCNQEQSRFNSEIGLYDQFRTEQQHGIVNIFLYFGHEIPENYGVPYDLSHDTRPFTVRDVADGMNGFLHRTGKFDLVVLS